MEGHVTLEFSNTTSLPARFTPTRVSLNLYFSSPMKFMKHHIKIEWKISRAKRRHTPKAIVAKDNTAQVLNINSLDNTQWNEALLQFKEYNIFQSYEWGELKKSEGWEPLRITVSDNDCMELTLIAQIVMKKVFGINIAWCQVVH